MCFRALKRKWHLRKIRKMHIKGIDIRSSEELYEKRKEVFSDFNQAIREERSRDSSYYSGMRDMLQWVLKEID